MGIVIAGPTARAVIAAIAASAASAASGCGLDIGAASSWVPVDQAAPPLEIESAAVPLPNSFRASHPPRTDVLRVVTYNIDQEQPTVTVDDLAAAITDTPALADAGVLLVQEAQHYAGEPSSRVARLAELLGLGYVFVPAHQLDNGDLPGLAILSAFPLENVEKMELPLVDTKPKIALAADIVVGDHRLHVIDVHLDLFANTSARLAELRPAVIDAPPATLVTGDFNMGWVQWAAPGVPVLTATSATDQSVAVDSYMRALAFETPAAGVGATAYSHGFDARADAMYPRGLDATFGGIEYVGPSDHWPLWIDVALQ